MENIMAYSTSMTTLITNTAVQKKYYLTRSCNDRWQSDIFANPYYEIAIYFVCPNAHI